MLNLVFLKQKGIQSAGRRRFEGDGQLGGQAWTAIQKLLRPFDFRRFYSVLFKNNKRAGRSDPQSDLHDDRAGSWPFCPAFVLLARFLYHLSYEIVPDPIFGSNVGISAQGNAKRPKGIAVDLTARRNSAPGHGAHCSSIQLGNLYFEETRTLLL